MRTQRKGMSLRECCEKGISFDSSSTLFQVCFTVRCFSIGTKLTSKRIPRPRLFNQREVMVCLFVWFLFYGPSTHLGHFGRSVTLITLFLSKPPRQYLVYIISPVNENCSTWISGRGRMAVELFSWPSLHDIMCRTSGSNSGPLACQADTLPIELPHPAWSYGPNKVDKRQWSETDKSQFTSYLKHQKGKEYHHWGRHQEEKEKEKKKKNKQKKKKKKKKQQQKTKQKTSRNPNNVVYKENWARLRLYMNATNKIRYILFLSFFKYAHVYLKYTYIIIIRNSVCHWPKKKKKKK